MTLDDVVRRDPRVLHLKAGPLCVFVRSYGLLPL